MRYWYAYTGESLVIGHGRAIRSVVSDAALLQPLWDAASKQYADYPQATKAIPKDTFIAALLAPLAVQEIGVVSPPTTVFSSAGQIMRLFSDLDIEQVAVNLFNGRISSAYSGNITQHVSQGFNAHDLMYLPRDTARLHSREIVDQLPGVLVFLLSHGKAQQKAFANYLRHGAPPDISDTDRIATASLRPVLATLAKEARIEEGRLA